MQIRYNQPLTEGERRFAEQNLSTIDRYLSRRHLNWDTYYDVVVFGYLRAVVRYLASEELRRYKFTTIANAAMDTEVSNYSRAKRCKKRTAVVLDIDSALFAGGLSIAEIIGDPHNENAQKRLEDRERIQDILSHATKQERNMLCMQAEGYTEREIGKSYHLSASTVSSILSEFRKRVLPGFSEGR